MTCGGGTGGNPPGSAIVSFRGTGRPHYAQFAARRIIVAKHAPPTRAATHPKALEHANDQPTGLPGAGVGAWAQAHPRPGACGAQPRDAGPARENGAPGDLGAPPPQSEQDAGFQQTADLIAEAAGQARFAELLAPLIAQAGQALPNMVR